MLQKDASMMVIETAAELRRELDERRRAAGAGGCRVALVPTMGNLHEGHISLVRAARARAEVVVVSVFVNPTQFDKPDDLARYPRTLREDCAKLVSAGADLAFAPAEEEMYPGGPAACRTFVEVPGLGDMLEGASRPGHFRGVATVVSKLFNLTRPDVACFGEKDYQQLALIRRMAADMGHGIEIVGVPTVRAADGLALSSRNGYLTAEERRKAPGLKDVMDRLAGKAAAGGRNFDVLLDEAAAELRARGFTPDPLFIRDADSLEPVSESSAEAVILMAAWLGKARLIDNCRVALKRG